MFAVGDVDVPCVFGLVLEGADGECFGAGCLCGFAGAADVWLCFDGVGEGVIV